MDVREFVEQTLLQVCEGVKVAAETAVTRGIAKVNPADAPIENLNHIEFDIALAVTEKTGKSRAAGLTVWSVGIGGSSDAHSSREITHRVKFSVPVSFHQTPCPKKD